MYKILKFDSRVNSDYQYLFKELNLFFDGIGFNNEKGQIFKIIAIILILGNIEFSELTHECCAVSDPSLLVALSEMMQVP